MYVVSDCPSFPQVERAWARALLARKNIAYSEEEDILCVLFPCTQVVILHVTLRVIIQSTYICKTKL